MSLRRWDELPEFMKNDQVRPYYDALKKKRISLVFKRLFDIVASVILLIILLPVFALIAIAIKLDSKGPVFYRQVRVTRYGERFRIFKFRSMVDDADKKGSAVTVGNDPRVTRVGRFIRKFRLDEICQLIDVLRGKMTFVGTRPEIPKYVEGYTDEMMATLLLPAGVTSEASIFFRNEAELLDSSEDADKTYVEHILPNKMKYNLCALKSFGFWRDVKIMLLTVIAVLIKKDG